MEHSTRPEGWKEPEKKKRKKTLRKLAKTIVDVKDASKDDRDIMEM